MARLIAATPAQGLGLPITIGGARLGEADLGSVVSIAPFREREEAVAKALGATFPEPNRMDRLGEARLVWVGPGRALLIGRAVPEGLSEHAAVVEQGDGIACVRLDGPAARAVLARLVPLDLRDRAFPEGSAARTLVNHMSATLLRVGPHAWEVMVMRSMAGTLVREAVEAMRHVAARAEAGVGAGAGI